MDTSFVVTIGTSGITDISRDVEEHFDFIDPAREEKDVLLFVPTDPDLMDEDFFNASIDS